MSKDIPSLPPSPTPSDDEPASTPDPSIPATPPNIPSATGAGAPRDEGLRELVFHAMAGGLTTWVPVPFLDDWLCDLIRRRQAGRLLQRDSIRVDDETLHILACGVSSPTAKGCVRGCITTAIRSPFKLVFRIIFRKILRKILFVFAIKDSIDTASTSFHESYLLRHACDLGIFPPQISAERAIEIRQAIEDVRDEVDPRPFERVLQRTFRNSRGLFRSAARRLSKSLGGLRRSGKISEDEAYRQTLAEEDSLGGVVDELTEEIRSQSGYLDRLCRHLESHLGVRHETRSGDEPKRE